MTAIKSEDGGYKPAPTSTEERAKIQQIMDIMCDACDEDKALAFLRRNNGSVDKAITALFDSGPDTEPTTSKTADYSELRTAVAGVVAPHTPPASQVEKAPVIDLTGDDLTGDDDDDELAKALKASLEDQGQTFGPSDRAPDPNWAVVPSDRAVAPTTTNVFVSQDDQEMSQAIEASLNYDMNVEPVDDRPLADRLRKGDSPVTLLPSQNPYVYASMVLHSLYFVPQVREYIASYRPTADASIDGTPGIARPPTSGPEHMVWTLLEIFVNMHYSRLNELDADAVVQAFRADPWRDPSRSPGEFTWDFYNKLAWAVEAVINGSQATVYPEPGAWTRLFHLRHHTAGQELYRGPFDKQWDAAAVRVTVRSNSDANDLVSCLSLELVDERDDFKQTASILEPSEVIAFQLLREPKPSGDRQKFSYPTSVFLDQFMSDNAVLSRERRRLRRDALREAEELQAAKASLLTFKGRDTLADLLSAVHYCENIAEHNDNEARRASLAHTAARLRKIIGAIEEECKSIDAAVEVCRHRAAEAIDYSGLQNHKYDLRVVLVHDGFYGRGHLYSYVKQKGQWWKIHDHSATEVSEEEVLNDSIGFHLGAGPYFLIYSRSMSEEEENYPLAWPHYLKNTVKENNRTFFNQLPPDIVAGVEDPNSTASSPYATPLEDFPPAADMGGGEPMDIDPIAPAS